MGRKATIDQGRVDKMLQAVRTGVPMDMAAQYAGIPRATFFDWVRKGRQPKPAAIYREFVDQLDEANAQMEVQALARISKAGEQEWQADAWRLERKFPDRYGRRTRIDGQVNVTATPMIDASKLTAAELEQLVTLLRKAAPAQEELAAGQKPALELLPGGEQPG